MAPIPRGADGCRVAEHGREKEIAEVALSTGRALSKQVAAAIVPASGRCTDCQHRTACQDRGNGRPHLGAGPGSGDAPSRPVRIYLNRELEELSLTSVAGAAALAPAGRLAVIAFHPLEDRIVKRFMQDAATGDRLPPRLPVRAA